MSRICITIRYSLIKARCVNGKVVDFNEVNPDTIEDHASFMNHKAALDEHKCKVKNLVDQGVMDLVYDTITARENGGALFNEAFMLAAEMAHGTNIFAQSRVAELLEKDYENKFLSRMMERLNDVGDSVVEHRRLQRNELSDESIATLDTGIATIEYLALLSEGHFAKNQDLMRTQPGHAGNVDIVNKIVQLSILICEDFGAVNNLSQKEVEFMTTLFNFMSELTQGKYDQL